MVKKKSSGKPMDASEMGKIGGRMRAKTLSAERKKEIARKGAAARWKKK